MKKGKKKMGTFQTKYGPLVGAKIESVQCYALVTTTTGPLFVVALRERPCIYVGMCSLPKKIFFNFFIFLKSRYQGMKLLCIYLGSTAKTVAVRAVSKFIEVNLGKTED